ncbi:thymidine kinase [Arenicella xantha]|uniref:Thymidine kinase n=1 Tax=Arenicella xantha TaxID=644221 RepID=A0A395JQX7_9GAMM|nr:thymidine kinase [Arenicella xantha]RBP52856.1 thymidine kinase [Arenicella xantha]
MAKLYFYYSTMNAGKSTTLLQSSFNYRERGMHTLLLTAAFDDRYGKGKVSSRIGLSQSADLFSDGDDLFKHVTQRHSETPIHCVLVDEAQFLSQDQVWQLSEVCDELGIPVLCYGIRTDFQGHLFNGSQWLLAWADVLVELKTICHCGSKANMVVRVDQQGEVIQQGSQVEIGGNDRYVSLCRRHFKSAYKTVE